MFSFYLEGSFVQFLHSYRKSFDALNFHPIYTISLIYSIENENKKRILQDNWNENVSSVLAFEQYYNVVYLPSKSSVINLHLIF